MKVDYNFAMKTSLIITTYNWKEALDLVLRSVARQSELPDEVLIADDGSRSDTAELVAEWARRLPVPVRHVWQEDLGFRLARSRNRAIAAARGDYLIIIDGDMVLHRHFIADHKRAAQPGYFIQGVRLLTEPETSRKMLAEGLMDLGFFASGVRRRRHTLRWPWLSWCLLQHVRTDQKAIRGSNQAYWKKDLLSVNGFDEQMVGWGREDNEIAARLYHSGIKRRNLKFAGLTIHLYHHQRKPQGENPNDRILRATQQQKLTRCQLGVDQYLVNTENS
ncbi:MAG: glycosyltransferase family 2 protein [Steroidobacteraceae bacterium]